MIAHKQQSARKYPRSDRVIGFIVALGIAVAADETPRTLMKRVAEREAQVEAARANYTYRQSVNVQELSPRGTLVGEYREVREIIFSPGGERSERLIEAPRNTLKALQLTEEDFRDVRELQPLLLTPDQLWNYDVKARGTESVQGIEDALVFDIRPRHVLEGQRLFDGTLWVDPRDFSVIRIEGQAVPQIRKGGRDNLFPRFTTVRQKVGGFYFPLQTYADDTLDFRSGAQRIRMTIRYSNYQRFGAESTIKVPAP